MDYHALAVVDLNGFFWAWGRGKAYLSRTADFARIARPCGADTPSAIQFEARC